jgi:type IX secretion system PorP/SprF family membrane protein
MVPLCISMGQTKELLHYLDNRNEGFIKMKNTIRIYFLGLLSCLYFVTDNKAQDFQFSQYGLTPIKLNPALVSVEKEIKISMLYHQTKMGNNLDMRNINVSATCPLNLTDNNRLPQGIGLSIYNSNIGEQGLTNSTKASFVFSQGVRISKWAILSAGLQASYHLYSNNNPGNYTTGSQWTDGQGFDENTGIDETISFETIHLFTVNSGVNLNFSRNGDPKGNLGFSLFNINSPAFSFLGDKNKLDRFYVVHGNYRVFKKNEISVTPRFLYTIQDINIMSIGTLVNYSFKSDNPFLLIQECNFQVGLDYRHDHTGIISFAIEQQRYILGISYAFNVNNNKAYTGNKNNFEIGLALKFNKPGKNENPVSEYNLGETRLIFNKGLDNKQTGKPGNTEKPTTLNNNNSDSILVTTEKYNIQLKEDFKFKFNDATLTSEAKNYLNDLAIMLKQNPELKIEVIGHTDDVGTEEANYTISEQRAKTVVEFLQDKGIDKSRIKYTAKGMSEPLVPNTNEENRTKNRRVEFIIYN